jgi:hypothetical protein
MSSTDKPQGIFSRIPLKKNRCNKRFSFDTLLKSVIQKHKKFGNILGFLREIEKELRENSNGKTCLDTVSSRISEIKYYPIIICLMISERVSDDLILTHDTSEKVESEHIEITNILRESTINDAK